MADRLSSLLSLEGRVAWRHLRADHVAPWVRTLTWVALYTLVVGIGLGLYAEFGLSAGADMVEGTRDASDVSPMQRGFSTFAFVSVIVGLLALIFGLFARYFSILSTIVIYAVLVGTMSLVVVPSMMSGLMSRLRGQILDQKAHLLIQGPDGRQFDSYEEVVTGLLAVDAIAGISPFVEGEVMVLSGIDRDGAILRGVVPSLFAKASKIESLVDEGRYDALVDPASIPEFDPMRGRPVLKELTVDAPPRDDESVASAGLKEDGDAPTARPQDASATKQTSDGGDAAATSGTAAARPATTREGQSAPGGLAKARARVEARLEAIEDEDEGWEDPVATLGLARDQPTEETQAEAQQGASPPSDGDARAGVPDPILIGRELALELGLHVGSSAQLITPIGRMTPAGRVPGIIKVKVGGIFYSKMYQYDKKLVYAPLETVQSFLRMGDRVSGIEVRLRDVDQLEAGKAAVIAALAAAGRDDLQVKTWQELNRNLFAAMYLEKIAMFVALSFVVLVSAFGILTSNLMSVLERYEEIAILKAMGASDRAIQLVFWAEGLCVGLVGGVSGIGLGLLLCWALSRFGVPFEAIYYMHEVPVEVHWGEVGLVGVCVLVVVWLFTLYPARIAARMRPVDTLRVAD